MLVYKILLPAEWDAFTAAGQFGGSPVDVDSGFIHLSSRAQVAGTARRFFADDPALVVVGLDAEDLRSAGDLRWEPASDGDLFPHLYGTLPMSAVVEVHHVAGAASVDDALTTS